MALIKEVNTNYGISADYWRIETITIDKRMKEASFIIHLYVNENAKSSLDYRVITIADKENKDELFNKYFSENIKFSNIYESCYECTKELDQFFFDAIDDNK